MKLKSAILLSLYLVIGLSLVTSANAFSITKLGKAEDALSEARNLAKTNFYEDAQRKTGEAIGYLKEILIKDPNDPKANEILGYCYWLLNDRGKAISAFKRGSANPAVKTNAVKFISDVANYQLAVGDIEDAFTLYDHILSFSPDNKQWITEHILEKGEHELKKGEYSSASKCFDKSWQLDHGLSDRISKNWYEAGVSLEDAFGKMKLFKLSLKYGQSYKADIIKEAKPALNKLPIPVAEKTMEDYPAELRIVIIQAVFEFTIYKPGDVVDFDLRGDTKASPWMLAKCVNIFTQREMTLGEYYIETRSGKIYHRNELPYKIDEIFRLVRENGDAYARLTFQ